MATAIRATHPALYGKHQRIQHHSIQNIFQPKIGSLINVESRHWPGINKPGGVGRVTAVHHDEDLSSSADGTVTHVDVKYVINGGIEKKVDMVFVQEQKFNDDLDCTLSNRLSRRGRKLNATLSQGSATEKNADKDIVEPKLKKSKRTKNEGEVILDQTNNESKKKNNEKAKPQKQSEVKLSVVTYGLSERKISEGKRLKDLRNKKVKKVSEKPNLKSEENLQGENKFQHNHAKGERNQPNTIRTAKTKATFPKKMSCEMYSFKSTPSKATSLEKVYKKMCTEAEVFVKDVVGGGKANLPIKEDHSCSSSSESLALTFTKERKSEFTTLLNGTVRRLMLDSIQIDDLRREMNIRIDSNRKAFTNLEMRSLLSQLEEENRVMVTWDTDTIYII